MISPWTKPGTKVVCVDNVAALDDFNPFLHDMIKSRFKIIPAPCVAGQLYTVADIVEHPFPIDGFAMTLTEFPADAGFLLRFFRPLDLPRSLTEILDRAPVDCADPRVPEPAE